MKVLGFNTAFKKADLFFYDGKETKFQSLDSSCKHAENIMVEIDKILNGTKIADLDIVAVITGPGSFTGLRIGIAIAKAFMTVFKDLKAVSINSLEYMSEIYQKTSPKEDYYTIINALSGNYFVEKFNKTGKSLMHAKMVCGEELCKVMEENCVGLKHEEIEFAKAEVEFSSENFYDYVMKQVEAKNFTEENQLLPVYLRLSQAEQNLKDKEDANKTSKDS